MYATDYFEKAILNLMNNTPIDPTTWNNGAKVYLALFMSNPGDSGAEGYEVQYDGYARQEIRFTQPAPVDTGLGMENADQISFSECAVNVGNVTHIGVMDHQSGGNMLLYGQLDSVLNVQSGITPIFRAGSIKFIFSGNLSVYYRTAIMNTLRGQIVSGFIPYLGLCNGNPEGSGSEFSGYSYARVRCGMRPPAEQPNGSTLISNVGDITSPEASGNWGMLSHVCLYDAVSDGHPFAIIPLGNSINITSQNSVGFHDGSLRFSIN